MQFRRLTAIGATAVIAFSSAGLGALSPAGAAVQTSNDVTTGTLTRYAFQNNSYAARVHLTKGVRTIKASNNYIDCTRTAGRVSRVNLGNLSGVTEATDALAEAGIDIRGLSSVNSTYQRRSPDGKRIGSLAINEIAGIALNPPLPPELTGDRGLLEISGLRFKADAFRDARGFGTATDAVWGEVNLTLPSALDEAGLPQEVKDLIDALESTTGDVLDQVVGVLQQVTGPIEIPGLASFKLGWTREKTTANFAQAAVKGVRIQLPDGARLHIGYSWARVNKGARNGVISSKSNTVAFPALLAPFGETKMPCVGTDGRVKKYSAPELTRLIPGLGEQLRVGKGESKMFGQQKRDGSIRSWTRSSAELINLGDGQIVLRDVVGRANVRMASLGKIFRNTKGSSVGALVLGGERQDLPEPGETMALPGDLGSLQTNVVRRTKRGLRISAVLLELGPAFDELTGQILSFGNAQASINRK